ncbi:YdhR family protein [Streptomyces tibetensis]|uniref:YdhR family protein n=1 Tax=Streptomyces tibetensis TaxID=2382123 RepID=UPI0033DF7613
MRADIVWWDLSASGQTIETMRDYLRDESVTAFSKVPGLRFKMWLSDPATNRWGAVLLWESEAASRQELPSRALELIGYPPVAAHSFDVEATTEGRYETQQLSLRGIAFTETADSESS